MRKKVIAGNWKMNKTVDEAVSLVSSIKAGVAKFLDTEIVVCPPYVSLTSVVENLSDSKVEVGAQNMYHETEGAFTGEISPMMLKDLGCRYVILGHSERRAIFHESNEFINKKLKTAIQFNFIPILCVGETLEERESGSTEKVVEEQLKGSLEGISNKEMSKVIIAYEPVWAIGTGKTASPSQAEEVHRFIRTFLSNHFAPEISQGVRILYGGSVKPDNINDLIKQQNIDGALVGGASLKAESFIQLVEAAENSTDLDPVS